ncbi:unnamed protein product [Rhizoctonia solani]|uniref:Caspase family p20 domain-containing protein n=1 Tax=Rhizoctonia solani TaxID=456999 RepID=A0A8H3GF19_9AGAM|nr:unnamed protein product [Rhizoctonia solani]
MSLGYPDAPVAKGRKSLTTWLNVLPTGPPLNAEVEQEPQPPRFNKTDIEGRASRGVATQVTRVPEQLPHDFRQPQAQIHVPRSRTPFGRPRTPLDRSRTPVNRTPAPFDLRTPPSRPQTPQSQESLGKQRPANIVVPSQSQACKEILAYNPNDRDRLRTAFQNRKYSVETMVEEEGNKNEILRRVGNFLASAEGGDIRMIVFTGHATRIGNDRKFAIIPWGCSSEDDTITSAEWQSVVLWNAAPGVVVVSVFATCMSGAAMEQSERLTNFDRIIEKQSLVTALPNGPIQIILSSSGDAQSSFEYHTPSHRSGSTTWHDYFLWALAETTQMVDVDSWESFVKTLQTTFNYVRTAGFRNSSFQYPHDLEWLLNHPQTPRIFVSSQMPDFDRFLPPPSH